MKYVVLYAKQDDFERFEGVCSQFVEDGYQVVLNNPKFHRRDQIDTRGNVVVTDRKDIHDDYVNSLWYQQGKIEQVILANPEPKPDMEFEPEPEPERPFMTQETPVEPEPEPDKPEDAENLFAEPPREPEPRQREPRRRRRRHE
jgi:hypothetical protein